jgi:hypothetical protein
MTRIGRLCLILRKWHALVWFGRKSDPAKRDGLIPLKDFIGTLVSLDNNGNWQRVVTVGAHVAKDHVLMGGGGFDPIDQGVEQADDNAENGMDGWWRARTGRHYLREDIPDAYVSDAVPEGHLKDVAAHPRDYISLFSNDPKEHQLNARTRARLSMILDEMEQLTPGDVSTALRAPSFFVAAGLKPLTIRALGVNHKKEDIAAMDELTATNIALGSWTIPDRESWTTPCICMDEGELGIVKEVRPDEVVIDHSGATLTCINPAHLIRSYIRERTGHDAADLDVVPIVGVGQQVERHSCLFGPVMPHGIGAQSLRGAKDGDAKRAANRRADLMGIWSILTEGQPYENQLLYPVALVAPSAASRVYASLIDKDGDFVGAQRVGLSGADGLGASMAAKARESGVRINLRNTSIREWTRRELKDRREREHREGTKH